MSKILLVCYISRKIGLGHLSRLLALAQTLKKDKKIIPEFLIFGDLIKKDELNNFKVHNFSADSNFALTIENLLKIQEFNRFNEENNLIHLGICSPPIINISKTLVNKINSQIKKLRFILENYYGVFGITFKLYKDQIYMYEINIGLPGDEITKSFFPYFYKKNLYDLEINNKSIDFKIQKKKKKFLYKKKFIKQIQTYSDEI